MPIRFNFCPYCHRKIVFKIDPEDINTKQYPAPVYILHNDNSCGKISTFYFDSLLRVSYTELGKKKGGSKIIETIN